MIAAVNIQAILLSVFIVLYFITMVSVILVILMENRNPLKTIAWLIVILLAPIVGLIIYFFFGQDNRKQRIISRKMYRRIMSNSNVGDVEQDHCQVLPCYKPLTKLLNATSQIPLLYGSSIQGFANGKEKFEQLLTDIYNAKEHIHLQYYIFNDDEIGKRVKQALIQKAHEGVEVRVIYDDVGCWNVKKSFFKEMKEEGIGVYPFLEVVFPIFSSKVNYRNHSKIVVIDGKIGYIGGMNIADRYLKGLKWGTWRDSHFRIEGKGVHGLQSVFLVNWYIVSKEQIIDRSYYPAVGNYTNSVMQIMTSGPVGLWKSLLQAYIYIISNAKKYVYIQTPYFLPTEGLNQALQTAALGGIDVRIMIPKHSDTKSVQMASCSYIGELLRAGVSFYFYEPGFLHSKLLVTDDNLACIGSANVDFRSFEHNFEITAFVYDADFSKEVKDTFLQDQEQSEFIHSVVWGKRPFHRRMEESFMRIFSPLL